MGHFGMEEELEIELQPQKMCSVVGGGVPCKSLMETQVCPGEGTRDTGDCWTFRVVQRTPEKPAPTWGNSPVPTPFHPRESHGDQVEGSGGRGGSLWDLPPTSSLCQRP